MIVGPEFLGQILVKGGIKRWIGCIEDARRTLGLYLIGQFPVYLGFNKRMFAFDNFIQKRGADDIDVASLIACHLSPI